ncbi:hypothetical protein BCR32DRAFT_329309, partial [Anaeromyces robustus]
MAILLLALYSSLGLTVVAAYIKFIHLPIRAKRSKRRVMQDNSAFIPSGTSPFAENIIEVEEITTSDAELPSPPEAHQIIKNKHENVISIDISSLRTPPTSINSLFPHTSVLM